MPDKNILVSGPAGGGKSQRVRELLQESETDTIVSDFQSTYASIRQEVRDPVSHKYPERDERYVPAAEYIRRATITYGVSNGYRVIVTNSDGDPDRRGFLLDLLGDGAEEQIIDPGEAVATARLAEADGVPSEACNKALQRWYSRHYRNNPRRRRNR